MIWVDRLDPINATIGFTLKLSNGSIIDVISKSFYKV